MVALLLLGRFAAVLALGGGTPGGRGQTEELTVGRVLGWEFGEQAIPDKGSWRPDGKTVLVERESKSTQEGVDLVLVDPKTGAAKVAVPARKLIPVAEKLPLRPEEYWLSDDGKHLLIFTNSQKVWRENTRGDYWALDVSSGRLVKLGSGLPASSLMFAKLSPDGSKAAYVYQNNLYVEDLGTETITPLTTDGKNTLINGTSDWVYEEELDIRDGWRWSPDGKSIAYWQIDSSAEPLFTLIDDTTGLYPKIKQFPYPETGQTNPTVRIGVVPVSGGRTTWMKDIATSESGYIARMAWTPDGHGLLLEHLNRLQNQNRYLIADAGTGEVRAVFTDSDPAWVDVLDTDHEGVRWIDGGKAFLALSEHEGWRRLYAVPSDGSAPTVLTPDPFDVDEIAGFDESTGTVYFTASPETSTQRYLYSTSVHGGSKPVRLTPAGSVGTNRYEVSPNGKLAFHSVSRFTDPGSTELISLPDHAVLRRLGSNEGLKSRLKRFHFGASKFIELNAADGSEMDASLIFPPDFDAKKKYPVMFNVYGEPAGAIVQDAWDGGHMFDRLIAQHGYIVAAVDNRGTPALKGRAWRKSVYRKIGVIASEDQAAAVKQLDKLPYVDAKRIAIWGWSGGGTMTLNMMFRYPDLYALGMAVAPVPDMHLYDTIYQERHMGTPQQNEEDYVKGSPITYASQLKGALLIVHGSGDDNVHYQGTERLINTLVADGKPFQLMVYPNRTHAIDEGPGTTRHLYELLFRFLTTNMAP